MTKRNFFSLQDGEQVIGSSDAQSIVFNRGGFVLTTQRVIMATRTRLGGETSVHAMNLENIDSIVVNAHKQYGILLFSIPFLVCAPFTKTTNTMIFVFVSGLFFLACYFLTRKKVIEIRSTNSVLPLNVWSMAHDKVDDLIAEIQAAKQRRLDKLKHRHDAQRTAEDPQHRLKRLDSLLQQGLISQDEYVEKRKDILNSV